MDELSDKVRRAWQRRMFLRGAGALGLETIRTRR